MKDLAGYITQAPDELIMQCIAITRAALNTEDAGFRETLLYVAFDKQLQLAKALGTINENVLIN